METSPGPHEAWEGAGSTRKGAKSSAQALIGSELIRGSQSPDRPCAARPAGMHFGRRGQDLPETGTTSPSLSLLLVTWVATFSPGQFLPSGIHRLVCPGSPKVRFLGRPRRPISLPRDMRTPGQELRIVCGAHPKFTVLPRTTQPWSPAWWGVTA